MSDVEITSFGDLSQEGLRKSRMKLVKYALIGMGCPTPYDEAIWKKYEHLVSFTGNQWNPDWKYKPDILDTLSYNQLNRMYTDIDYYRSKL